MVASRWTLPEDLVARLRRRWERGQYLQAHARGDPWTPVTLPIKGPSADDLLQDSASVVAWIDELRRASTDRRRRERFCIEYRTIRNRLLGDNEIPARMRVDSLRQMAELLGTTAEVGRLDEILGATQSRLPAAVAWVADHPMEALAHSDVWDHLLSTAMWIVDHGDSTLDVRHLDIPGVDTKFVEGHKKVLGHLLDEVLPAGRVDPTASDFARRYGLRPRPRYVRLRLLSPLPVFPTQVTELEVRADELALLTLPIRTVFVVENKASYLSFPCVPDAVAVFGEGFAVTTLELVPWLSELEVVYWGDIDTHGFAILDRLRERVPTARSILMDQPTLMAHRNQLTTEPTPTSAPLPHLTSQEAELYRDLVEDRYGPAVRLEQERVRFSHVRVALVPWNGPPDERT